MSTSTNGKGRAVGARRAEFLTETGAVSQPAPMNFLGKYSDPIYCIMRFVVGLMFACHGAQLVLGKFGGMPGADKPLLQVGGWIQLIAGLLIALGLLTRLAAFISSGEMAVAYFLMHVGNAATPAAKFFPILNKGELAVIYCFIFLYIAARGAGLWSVDGMMGRGRTSGTTGTL